MRSPKPVCIPTDTELQARHKRKRRWIIRASVAALFLLLAVILVALALTTSALTIEEAKALYARLNNKSTRSEVENVMGRPLIERTDDGETTCTWIFVKSSFDQVEWFGIFVSSRHDGKGHQLHCYEETLKGWDAWTFRWKLLQARLGIKVDG